MIYAIIYVSFIYLGHAQIGQLNFTATEQFSESIDLSTSNSIIQETVVMTRSVSNNEALFNVTLIFDDGNGDYCFQGGCLNPTITIKAEHTDLNGAGQSDEFVDIYFGAYANDSRIARCSNHSGEDGCGVFTDCIQEYQPPAGCYNALNFFIYQADGVFVSCTFNEQGQPDRSLRLKFVVSCDAAGQCEENECGELQGSRRRLGGDLLENESVGETAYDLELECKQYDDAFTGFLVFVGICWIVQCGGFYVYKIK